MIKRCLVIALAYVWIPLFSDSHPIIYLISPPRSLSVAFTRMINQRGDFFVFSEPSQWAYAMRQEKQWSDEKVFKDEAPASFEEVKRQLFAAAQIKPVYVKEISFAVFDFLVNDIEFIKHPQVQFVFLTRNPHHALVSFYNKLQSIPDKWADLVGYECQYRLFQKVKEHARKQPIILHAEDLYLQPNQILYPLCKALNISFVQEALDWTPVPSSFTGEEWHEIKYPQHTQYWHDAALNSSGFHRPNAYEEDQEGVPTFSEITNPEHKQLCKQAYRVNKQFYDLLLEEKEYTIRPNPNLELLE